MAKTKSSKKKAAPAKASASKGKAPSAKAKSDAAPKKVKREVPTGPAKFDKVSKTRTKSQVIQNIAENTGLSKKEIAAVFESFAELIQFDLKKGGPGMFTVPGLVKLKLKQKPARKARKGTNPFTGEEMMFKAKPASNVVRCLPLKKLKEMV